MFVVSFIVVMVWVLLEMFVALLVEHFDLQESNKMDLQAPVSLF